MTAYRDNKGKFKASYLYSQGLCRLVLRRERMPTDPNIVCGETPVGAARELGRHLVKIKESLSIGATLTAQAHCLEAIEHCISLYKYRNKGGSKAFFTELSDIAKFGAEKYGDLSYLRGFSYRETMDSIHRHLCALYDVDNDEESGKNHIVHVVANLLLLHDCIDNKVGVNDYVPTNPI